MFIYPAYNSPVYKAILLMKGAILVLNICLDPLITVTKEILPNLFVDLRISSREKGLLWAIQHHILMRILHSPDCVYFPKILYLCSFNFFDIQKT